MYIYIAACDENGGVYRYSYTDGAIEFIDKTPMDRPMFISFSDNKMHVVLRAPFEGNETSGVVTYDLDNGKPVNPSEIFSTEGLCGCHIVSDKEDIYVTNYLSGSVKKIGGKLDTHEGHGPHPTRQEGPHTHQAVFTPDGKYLCVTDLGLDTVFVYDRELNLISTAKVPEGHGARHMAWNGDIMYCVNELTATVTVFEYSEGHLTPMDTFPSLPSDFKEKNTAAAIRVCNNLLYVSNRGHDSIEQFLITGNSLELISSTPCGGLSPRDFNITPDGKTLICTNETTDNVTIFDIDGEKLTKRAEEFTMEHPLCVCFR